jgi:hypothetical protein
MIHHNGALRKYRHGIISTAAVATLAIGLGGAGVAAASANPAACGPSNAIVHLQGPGRNLYICAVTTVNTTGRGPFNLIEKTTHNRVWLHQNANGSGWADCFWADNADVPLTGRDQNPGNVQVSSNTASC